MYLITLHARVLKLDIVITLLMSLSYKFVLKLYITNNYIIYKKDKVGIK